MDVEAQPPTPAQRTQATTPAPSCQERHRQSSACNCLLGCRSVVGSLSAFFFFFNAAVSSVVGCWSAVALWGAGWLWNVGIRYFEWFIQDVDPGQLMQAPIPTKPVQFQDF